MPFVEAAGILQKILLLQLPFTGLLELYLNFTFLNSKEGSLGGIQSLRKWCWYNLDQTSCTQIRLIQELYITRIFSGLCEQYININKNKHM